MDATLPPPPELGVGVGVLGVLPQLPVHWLWQPLPQ